MLSAESRSSAASACAATTAGQKLVPASACASVLSELCESSGIGERAPLSDMSLFSVSYISSRRFARVCVERRGREKLHKMPQDQIKQAQDKKKLQQN